LKKRVISNKTYDFEQIFSLTARLLGIGIVRVSSNHNSVRSLKGSILDIRSTKVKLPLLTYGSVTSLVEQFPP